jgi:hypothetical protein
MKDEVKKSLENLSVKKVWKINCDGTKVKVSRTGETAFDSYLNGNYVTTDETWERAFELVQVLLEDK